MNVIFNNSEEKNESMNVIFNISERKYESMHDAFNKAKDFIDKCLKGILTNNQTIKPSENPKVSAIIPLYNCKKTILRAIKSIQNQNMSDFEIILVNDFSKDETLSIIEQMQKEDQRIKLLIIKKILELFLLRENIYFLWMMMICFWIRIFIQL